MLALSISNTCLKRLSLNLARLSSSLCLTLQNASLDSFRCQGYGEIDGETALEKDLENGDNATSSTNSNNEIILSEEFKSWLDLRNDILDIQEETEQLIESEQSEKYKLTTIERNSLYQHLIADFDPNDVTVNLDCYNRSYGMIYKFMDIVNRGFDFLTIAQILEVIQKEFFEECRRLTSIREYVESRIPAPTRKAPLTVEEGMELTSLFLKTKEFSRNILSKIEQTKEMSAQCKIYRKHSKLPLDAERLTNRFVRLRFPSMELNSEERKNLDDIRNFANLFLQVVDQVDIMTRTIATMVLKDNSIFPTIFDLK
ncbi:unnamed protein product [Caenorhabditis bovis]|uniref:Uncharacterized protein n=1 Tax=Caenorhabditis bovis TaxID=2654633 RepID=A0A8S1FF56_9PELO|nr:unnamed protein product [Caenorhabditis bovis]